MPIQCIAPVVVSRKNWGTDALAIPDLNMVGDFQCVAIAPDSEAYAVELRPNGSDAFKSRILVTTAAPYFGSLEGKGLSVYPVLDCYEDDDYIKFGHLMKINLYRSPPPFVPRKRADQRHTIRLANVAAGQTDFPILCSHGRKRHFFTMDGIEASAPIEFYGGVADQSTPARIDRFAAPNIAVASMTAHEANGNILWTLVNTDTSSTSEADVFSWQYEGNFDFWRIRYTPAGANSDPLVHARFED